jgi:1-deoxy-D-xylulose-5-phosphate synthase
LRELPIGKGELLRDGEDLAILAIGPAVYPALAASDRLSKDGIRCAVANARFAKPLDTDLILDLAKTKRLISVEEDARACGFGTAVLELLSTSKRTTVKVQRLGGSPPVQFVDYGGQEVRRSGSSLDGDGIAESIRTFFPELSPAPAARSGVGNP